MVLMVALARMVEPGVMGWLAPRVQMACRAVMG
jgi:hypothetical protein